MVLDAEQSVIRELGEVLTFEVPNAKFMKRKGANRYSNWDGRIRLLNSRTGVAYLGLHRFVKEYCEENDYEVFYEDGIGQETPFSVHEANEFLKSLKFHIGGTPAQFRDYQVSAFIHAVQTGRCILLSPTASGKSAIIYALIRYYLPKIEGKVLLVVPTTSLVEQMYGDFADYSSHDRKFDVEAVCHRVYGGVSPDTDKRVVISTWQSLYKKPAEWFEQFSMIVCDEAHQYDADSIKGVAEKSIRAEYRFATTGTLKESRVSAMVLEGLFGSVRQVTTTRKLMDAGTVADLTMKCLVLQYDSETCRLMKGCDYQSEVDFISNHEGRRKFIRNLALSRQGNTLVLFSLVEKQGKPLYDAILSRLEETGETRKVFFITGKVEALEREEMRRITEEETDAIIVGSYGCLSTGVNIKNLDNVIFASGSKSRVRVGQSIGRGLRTSDRKQKVTVYDIVDDLRYKTSKNLLLKHFEARLAYYAKEQFRYDIHRIKMYE